MIRPRLTLCITLLALFPALLFSVSQGQAHGVGGVTDMSETICATATYDDGAPMSYGAVEIVAPNSNLPFQSGRTDRNGLFCFKPDSPGQWHLAINDEMGHRVRLQTTVSQDMVLAPSKTGREYNSQPKDKANGIISGLGFIFGVAGSLAWWQNRKNVAKLKDED